MPYGYGASQDYYDQAVSSSTPNFGGAGTGGSNQRPQGNISADLDQLLQQSNQVSPPSVSNTQQDQGGWSPAAGRDESGYLSTHPSNVVAGGTGTVHGGENIVTVDEMIDTPLPGKSAAELYQEGIAKSQKYYEMYGDNLSNWPEAAIDQAQMSGFFGMQGEGMLGGVTAGEKEINAQKKIIQQGGAGYDQALASLTAQFGSEELAKMSALGIDEYLRRKTKGDYGAMEDILRPMDDPKRKVIEGLENFNFNKFIGQTGGLEEQYYDKNTGKAITDEEAKNNPNAQLGLGGDAMGHDPSGVYTWEDVESDPWLSEAYYGLTTGKMADGTEIPDYLYDKYLHEILYSGHSGDYENPRQWDSWDDPFWGGHEQPAGEMDSLADYARHHWFSESLSDVERREQQRLEEGLGLATMSDMEQMYGPDFAADANPFFDPTFSYKYTGDLSPLGAGMELFEMAKESKGV